MRGMLLVFRGLAHDSQDVLAAVRGFAFVSIELSLEICSCFHGLTQG
jgi:hypothetical protein